MPLVTWVWVFPIFVSVVGTLQYDAKERTKTAQDCRSRYERAPAAAMITNVNSLIAHGALFIRDVTSSLHGDEDARK